MMMLKWWTSVCVEIVDNSNRINEWWWWCWWSRIFCNRPNEKIGYFLFLSIFFGYSILCYSQNYYSFHNKKLWTKAGLILVFVLFLVFDSWIIYNQKWRKLIYFLIQSIFLSLCVCVCVDVGVNRFHHKFKPWWPELLNWWWYITKN